MRHRLTATAAAATVATSVVLHPLVAGAGWFWLGVVSALVAALAGTLTRLRRVPAVLCLLAGLGAQLISLNLTFASAQSFAGLAPTASSLRHLGALVQQGMRGVHRYAPPVPPVPGILLLTAAGIGIVAVLTDVLAVRLRRPALAGLPLLVLFCVPLSTSARPGLVGVTLGFGLPVAGYLAMLSADGRDKVRLWGRLVSVWPGGRADGVPETRKLAAAGRRIGFAAIVLALFVPLLLPGRQPHRLLAGSSVAGDGPSGEGAVYLPDPVAVLNQQLHEGRAQTVLTYRTTEPIPPYLQVYVLGQLSDTSWSIGRDAVQFNVPAGTGPLPRPPGLSAATPGPTLREAITLNPRLAASTHGLTYLPIPYPARSLKAPGSWRADPRSLTVFAAGASLSGLRYTVTAKDVNPSPQQLRRAPVPPQSVRSYLPVPHAFAKLLPLAKRITARRDSAYGRAVALQRWFTGTGGFTYSLNVPEAGSSRALIGFLTKSKRGYCQQFAFGMAVLARLLGIPSRVVIGYTQGTFLGGSLWRVTTRDAHAWPELYFQGAGWLRFEPTPDGSAGPGQTTATAPNYSFPVPPVTVTPTTPAATAPASGARTARRSRELPGNVRGQLRTRDAGGGRGGKAPGQPVPVGWLAAGMLVLALVTPRSAWWISRRRRWRSAADDAARAEAAWREVTGDLADHGIGCRGSESPRRVEERVSGSLRLTELERAALGRVVSAVERARYARTPAAPQTLRADAALLRRAVARSCGRAVRWRARIIPASVLAPARAGGQQLLDVFGWLDRLTLRADGRSIWQRRAHRPAG